MGKIDRRQLPYSTGSSAWPVMTQRGGMGGSEGADICNTSSGLVMLSSRNSIGKQFYFNKKKRKEKTDTHQSLTHRYLTSHEQALVPAQSCSHFLRNDFSIGKVTMDYVTK